MRAFALCSAGCWCVADLARPSGYVRQTGRFLIRDCVNCTLSYNPEFIAQGDVINGLLKPDMVLIGEVRRPAGLYLGHALVCPLASVGWVCV